MKHTKEPWKTYKGNTHEIFANDGDVIASSEECHIGHREAAANAQRIVACVNACSGITNEALEAGYIKHLVEWDEVNHNCIDIVDSVKTPFEFKGVPIKEDV